MKMKKIILPLSVVMLLAGCGGNTNTSADSAPKATSEPVELTREEINDKFVKENGAYDKKLLTYAKGDFLGIKVSASVDASAKLNDALYTMKINGNLIGNLDFASMRNLASSMTENTNIENVHLPETNTEAFVDMKGNLKYEEGDVVNGQTFDGKQLMSLKDKKYYYDTTKVEIDSSSTEEQEADIDKYYEDFSRGEEEDFVSNYLVIGDFLNSIKSDTTSTTFSGAALPYAKNVLLPMVVAGLGDGEEGSAFVSQLDFEAIATDVISLYTKTIAHTLTKEDILEVVNKYLPAASETESGEGQSTTTTGSEEENEGLPFAIEDIVTDNLVAMIDDAVKYLQGINPADFIGVTYADNTYTYTFSLKKVFATVSGLLDVLAKKATEISTKGQMGTISITPTEAMVYTVASAALPIVKEYVDVITPENCYISFDVKYENDLITKVSSYIQLKGKFVSPKKLINSFKSMFSSKASASEQSTEETNDVIDYDLKLIFDSNVEYSSSAFSYDFDKTALPKKDRD